MTDSYYRIAGNQPVARKRYIYVLHGDHNRVKIGITDNPRRRIVQLQNSGGFLLTNHYVSDATELAEPIETLVHAALSEYHVTGEWFQCEFDTACNLVKSLLAVITLIASRRFYNVKQTIKDFGIANEELKAIVKNLNSAILEREHDLLVASGLAEEGGTWGDIFRQEERAKHAQEQNNS